MWLIKQTNMVDKYLHKSLCGWIHVTGNSILLNKAAIPDMTCRKWTTDEQEAWLEQRKPAFLEANQKKTAAKDFFPARCGRRVSPKVACATNNRARNS